MPPMHKLFTVLVFGTECGLTAKQSYRTQGASCVGKALLFMLTVVRWYCDSQLCGYWLSDHYIYQQGITATIHFIHHTGFNHTLIRHCRNFR